MKKYKHIFFDLDHTLWDFDKNSEETLTELYHCYKLSELGVTSLEGFIEKYKGVNNLMWKQYAFGQIDKAALRNQRFALTFKELGLSELLVPEGFSDDYVSLGPQKLNLMPHAYNMLEFLSEKYVLHIITNGFEEVQFLKLENTGILKFFKEIITSEQAGYKKPDKHIFYYSLDRANASLDNSLMIGDSRESDIIGAQDVGIDQVYYNPRKLKHREKPTYEIDCLSQLKNIL